MNWIYIVSGIVLLLLLFAAVFSFLSDPQEVDAEEASSVRDEGIDARNRMHTREEARTKAEQERELKEARESPGDDFM